MDNERYEQGLKLRREMLGEEYVNQAIEGADDFSRPFQELATEYVWGNLWHREGLAKRDRILINLAILSATNMPNEVRLYVKIARRFGMSKEDIREYSRQFLDDLERVRLFSVDAPHDTEVRPARWHLDGRHLPVGIA